MFKIAFGDYLISQTSFAFGSRITFHLNAHFDILSTDGRSYQLTYHKRQAQYIYSFMKFRKTSSKFCYAESGSKTILGYLANSLIVLHQAIEWPYFDKLTTIMM